MDKIRIMAPPTVAKAFLRLLCAGCITWNGVAAGAGQEAQDSLNALPHSQPDNPFGREGLVGHYRIEQEGPRRQSVVERFDVRFGPVEKSKRKLQWLEFHATKADATTFRVWLLCERNPPVSLAEAQQSVSRYLLQEGDQEVLEFRDRSTGRAVLPVIGAWPYLLPRSVENAPEKKGFPEFTRLLGHRYRLESVDELKSAPPPSSARVLELRADVLIGVPHNTKQEDDTRRWDRSEYPLIRLTAQDYDAMIASGMNCFNVDAEQRRWIEHRAVYNWGGGVAELAYPEFLYRSTYLGPALFLDEPAVVTRDYVIRPRLEKEPGFARQLTPQIMLEAFREHFRKAKYEGAPRQLIQGLASRGDVDLGDMKFAQANLYTWETMISTAIDQLGEGQGPPPWAMVFEPPGHLGTRRTLPEMNMAYGCQIPITTPAHLSSILYGFLRGAARLSGREWGTSIYGAVDRADSLWLLTQAYDLGARLFFFWDNAQLACVPFRECLALSRHLTWHMENWPNRDLQRLKAAAETIILLPAGYNLGHVHMGKGSLWGLGELNLERTNSHGIKYRTVMHNFFVEVERCLRLGVAYDLVWDVPGLNLSGYSEVVRVREDGHVQIQNGSGSERTILDAARVPARPGGLPPELTVEVTQKVEGGFSHVTARARVIETSAPVFYTPRPSRLGVYENAVVFWELFGPEPEDYRVLLAEGLRPEIETQGSSHEVTIHFAIRRPGVYRLRAASVDAAGRSTVAWRSLEIRE